MHTSVSEIESLAGMNSCRFGVYIVLVSIFRGGGGGGGGRVGSGRGEVTKVTLSCCNNPIFFIQSDSAEKWPNREQIALNANSTALGCLRV